jgi:anthranilate/para-aminobenzoate synthase component II
LRKLKLEGALKNKRQGKFPFLGVCVAWQCITTTTKMVARATSSLPPPDIAIEL